MLLQQFSNEQTRNFFIIRFLPCFFKYSIFLPISKKPIRNSQQLTAPRTLFCGVRCDEKLSTNIFRSRFAPFCRVFCKRLKNVASCEFSKSTNTCRRRRGKVLRCFCLHIPLGWQGALQPQCLRRKKFRNCNLAFCLA